VVGRLIFTGITWGQRVPREVHTTVRILQHVAVANAGRKKRRSCKLDSRNEIMCNSRSRQWEEDEHPILAKKQCFMRKGTMKLFRR